MLCLVVRSKFFPLLFVPSLLASVAAAPLHLHRCRRARAKSARSCCACSVCLLVCSSLFFSFLSLSARELKQFCNVTPTWLVVF